MQPAGIPFQVVFPALLLRDVFAALSDAAKQALNTTDALAWVTWCPPSRVFLLGRALSAASQVYGILVVEKGSQGCFSCSNSV